MEQEQVTQQQARQFADGSANFESESELHEAYERIGYQVLVHKEWGIDRKVVGATI